MSNYTSDRSYTNHNHELAEAKIYARYGIEIVKPITKEEKEAAEAADIFEAIDYIGYIEKTGMPFAIQERTRDAKYAKFNDVTIRFERPQNSHEDRQKSEFYKLDAYFEKNPNMPFLMMYAVRGEEKGEIVDDGDATFQKYAFLDLRKLFKYVKSGDICVCNMGETVTSFVVDGVLYAPTISNCDSSSVFFSVDVGQLAKHFPDVVLEQQGFDAPKIPLEPGYKPEFMYSKIQGSITSKQSTYIQDLMKKHNYAADIATIRNLSIRQASEVITLMLQEPDVVLERYPQMVTQPEKQKHHSQGLDI